MIALALVSTSWFYYVSKWVKHQLNIKSLIEDDLAETKTAIIVVGVIMVFLAYEFYSVANDPAFCCR